MWYARRQRERNPEQESPVLTLTARDRDRLNEDIRCLSMLRPFNTASGQEFVSRYRKNLEGNERRESAFGIAAASYENTDPQDRIESLNQSSDDFLAEFNNRQQSEKFKRLLTFRQKLPAFKMRQDIVEKIKSNQVLVISGETG
jgi:ATP-dependent RNA helicase DHX36